MFNQSYIGLRHDLISFINDGDHKVLDVGCSIGETGAYLKANKKAAVVLGVEFDPVMVKEASIKLDVVYAGDVEVLIKQDFLKSKEFDFIICGDILEHLVDPWRALSYFSTKLSPEGKIIISLPNIQHIDTFYFLFIKGIWPLNNRGIYDKTHLRFFTRKSVLELIKVSGLKLDLIKRKFRFRDRLGSKFPKYTSWVLTKIFPNLFTFQYVIVCSK